MIEVAIDGRGVATVVIDNAAKLNTLNSAVMTGFVDAFDRLSQEVALRCVVLRGAGERAFVGGADIREMAALEREGAARFITLVHRCCDAPRRLSVPVIARIQGYALGAGLELAASCDLRVASEDAIFGMPEVRIGLPSVVEAALLPKLIGWGRTRRLLLTGDMIGASEAERWGLVESVVPAAELDAEVERLLASILTSGPRALTLQKELMREWEQLGTEAAVQRGIGCFESAFATDEPQRMMAAFLQQMAKRRSG
jgi:enoyl-CoA hydratase